MARPTPKTNGWMGRPSVVLFSILFLGMVPGGAWAAEPASGPSTSPASDRPSGPMLAIPDDASIAALAVTAIDDAVIPYTGEIDMARLQEDAIARAATLAAEDYEGPALALALAFDPDEPFLFVRDRIGFDPYRGLLRGADGTLAARSGNSLDRAVLLRSLLEQMAVPSRLAFAELTQAQAEAVVERSLMAPVAPLPESTPQTQAPLDWRSIAARASRDYGRLRAALGEHVASMGTADRDDSVAGVRSHAWVQAFIGTGWVDLDPTMPDARPGDRLAEPTLVADEVPADEIPNVIISLIAETYDGQDWASSTVLSESLPAWQAADSQVLLSFLPEFPGVGGSIIEALGEAGSFVPHLAVAGIDRPGTPFPVRPGTDIFSGETEAGPRIARLRLEIGTGLPGSERLVGSRTLLDRLPPGTAAPTDGPVSGLELLDLATDEAGPVDLQPIRHIMVSTGASSPWLHANDRVNLISFVNELLVAPDAIGDFDFYGQVWPITATNQALVLGAERTVVEALDDDPRVRAFVAEPRVYIVSMGGRPERPEVSTDLVHDPVAVLEEPASPGGSAARAELWYGAVQTASETEFLRVLLSGLGGGTVASVSTASDAPLTVFDDSAGAALAGAPASLLTALDGGMLAVVPGEPSSAPGWWTVDPRDGTTRSVGRDGQGWGRGAGAGNRGGRPISTPSHDPNRFKYKPTGRTPVPTCTRANEYTTPIGCVSLPAAIAFWTIGGLTLVGFAWGVTMLWQAAIGFGQ